MKRAEDVVQSFLGSVPSMTTGRGELIQSLGSSLSFSDDICTHWWTLDFRHISYNRHFPWRVLLSFLVDRQEARPSKGREHLLNLQDALAWNLGLCSLMGLGVFWY